MRFGTILVRIVTTSRTARAEQPRQVPRGSGAIGVVNAATDEFVTDIPIQGDGVHSVAVNAANGHIFVPVNGKGILVLVPGK